MTDEIPFTMSLKDLVTSFHFRNRDGIFSPMCI